MSVRDGKVRLYNCQDITFEDALASESNIIAQSEQYSQTIALKVRLFENAAALRQLVGAHLGLDSSCIQLDIPHNWRQGSFNLVLPMLIYDNAVEKSIAPATGAPAIEASVVRRVVLRWPIPDRCGEAYYPGAVLEKMCCEAASYVWMQRHCPDIRIPQLYGFGLPTGQHFTQVNRLPWFRRILLGVRQVVASLLRWPVPSQYQPFQPPPLPLAINSGYMLLEHFGPEVGEIIPLAIRDPQTPAHSGDDTRRRNLYSSLSRIMLSIARVPHSKIGAFCFDPKDGTIALANRPVTCETAMLENEGVPRVMQPGVLFTSAQAYIDKLLSFQDVRFRSLPNSVSSRKDCQTQMSVQVLFRAVANHFQSMSCKGADDGPFRLRLTDFNAANFLIDKDWNVTAMYDLEWIVAMPLSMHEAPYWLAWKSIDESAGKFYDESCASRAAFMEVFRAEEKAQAEDTTPISDAMDSSWTSGRYWLHASLLSVNALHNITQYRLRHIFGLPESLSTEYWRLWAPDAEAVADLKVRDRAAYVTDVASLFGRDSPVAT